MTEYTCHVDLVRVSCHRAVDIKIYNIQYK